MNWQLVSLRVSCSITKLFFFVIDAGRGTRPAFHFVGVGLLQNEITSQQVYTVSLEHGFSITLLTRPFFWLVLLQTNTAHVAEKGKNHVEN